MTTLIGQSLGRYHILEQLGEGGMAVVYRAFDTRLERNVAIKVILPSKEHSEKFLKRFEREAKSLAQLSHPNIVKVIDYGEHEGLPYLVMEYLPGGTLKQKLAGKPMPWQEAARILIPIARALAYAHESKIIHRDIKPSNILVTQSGEPMLSDFGIAKILEAEETLDLTGTGVGVGTPEYMSPEQAQGQPVDGRSDVYSLGVVFYEMVTGRKPYQADTPYAVVIKHVNEPLPNPRIYLPSLPTGVESTLHKALAKKPENRYQNMADFGTAMERIENSGDYKKVTQSSRLFLAAAIIGMLSLVIYITSTQFLRLRSTEPVTETSMPYFGEPVGTRLGSSPTKTALVPISISTVQSVELQGQSGLYDSFDSLAYDGKYDSSLWSIEYGKLPSPAQSDGRLAFYEEKATEDHEIALRAKALGTRLLSEIDFVQADLGFGGDTNSAFSHIAINLAVKNTPKGDYWIEADLINSEHRPILLCKIGYYANRETKEYEQYYDGGFEYGQLYVVRIELDKTSYTVRWFVNNAIVCEHTSKELSVNIDRDVVFILNSNRGQDSHATTYVDNVFIGKP